MQNEFQQLKDSFGQQLNILNEKNQKLILENTNLNQKLIFENESNKTRVFHQKNFFETNRNLESARINDFKNEMLSKRTESSFTPASKYIQLGFFNKRGINFGREVFLGPRDGVHFINQFNNKSYLSQNDRINNIFFN